MRIIERHWRTSIALRAAVWRWLTSVPEYRQQRGELGVGRRRRAREQQKVSVRVNVRTWVADASRDGASNLVSVSGGLGAGSRSTSPRLRRSVGTSPGAGTARGWARRRGRSNFSCQHVPVPRPPTVTPRAPRLETNLALQNTGKTDHNDNVECSDAGLCDRSYGVCQCFSGYEGSSCRTECPNDCSNPGTRMTNTLFATDAGVRYSWAWDNGKHYGCKCDTGFRGADFSFKEWLPIVYGPRSARRARIR